jgi:hypothetical protein
LFDDNWKYFRNEVHLAIIKIVDSGDSEIPTSKSEDIKELREYDKLSMFELREKDTEYWRKLRDEVFEKYKDKNGFYTCAISGEKSRSKILFQIDHIKPISKGGLTILNNLQILTRSVNKLKGNK